MQLIRKTNHNITSWITPKPIIVIENDWSDDISIPDLRCTEEIERKENAKMKADSWMGQRICRDVLMEMICKAESISSVSLCIKVVMDNAWKSIKEIKIKKLLEDDKELVTFTSDLILSWRVREIRGRENKKNEERMLRQAILTMEWKARREMMMEIDPAEMTLSLDNQQRDDSTLIVGMEMMTVVV